MDRELVERARDGDHAAFGLLASRCVDRLFAIARLILRDVDDADDAVQDALVHAWQELPRLRDVDRWDAWVHRLLVNACADQGRRRRRFAANIRVLPVEPALPDRSGEIADRAELDQAFRRLTIDHRAIVVLHHYADLPLPRAAEVLDIPLGTAKSRLHHAMAALRAALDAEGRVDPQEALA